MAQIELLGYRATIGEGNYYGEPLNLDAMHDEVRQSGKGELPHSVLMSFIFRNSTDRQRVMLDERMQLLTRLSTDEKHPDIVVDILKCLGDFPEFEKRFLINILSRTDKETFSDTVKTRYLEEVLFSKNDEFLHDFITAKASWNKTIVKCLDPYPHIAVIKAVELLLHGKDPFPDTIGQQQGPEDELAVLRNLNHAYASCRGTKARRCLHLKSLLKKADDSGDVLMLMKLVFSHCNFDLKSILGKIRLKKEDYEVLELAGKREEIDQLAAVPITSFNSTATGEYIRNPGLRNLINLAAFGEDALL